ncbi:putative acid phosphatase precursor [Suhomyces tanzawaensis NRRL Y-17324]|uniref:Putative acid phosphatase n=1 Tax=Suhomyces tanzawaensis NRRL Y-17324 TaxID=984487 RepID=A0A1E4SRR6_9ASCO|nr:putative acid phosphatase precursor [Suhomyces tanzawaensis NRRL Y-17324]ODV82206.1 putative acid phosphatase precursor [Suhomyces tanzawaensis NRRL Y-17324]
MVAISKLINNGLLLVNQGVFQSLASPQQASVEQYNILRYLGGAGPYIQRQGYGISTDVPEQCTLEQVQLLSRHGERYPSNSVGKKLEAIYKKFKSYNGTFTGDFGFLNDYTYFVDNSDLYEKETSPKNSDSNFAGTTDALKHGAAFRRKYGSLFNENETFPVFSSNSGRCFQTGVFFTRGFFGDDYEDDKVTYVVVDEDKKMGANSLTPRAACASYNDTSSSEVKKLDTTYLKNIITRFQKFAPGLNLTQGDVSNLFQWCAYELNVRGSSPFCDLFSNEEFIQYSYGTDVSNYYANGAGNNLTAVIGSTLLNASLTLLKDNSSSNKVWLSFTHDTDLEIFHSALGLLEPKEDLPTDYIPFPYPYLHSSIVPQGARIYTEKYKCGQSSYVRYIINDAVVPIPKCSSGPGFSCEFSAYEDYIKERIGNINFAQQCDLAEGAPSTVEFYWNYNQEHYNASLING